MLHDTVKLSLGCLAVEVTDQTCYLFRWWLYLISIVVPWCWVIYHRMLFSQHHDLTWTSVLQWSVELCYQFQTTMVHAINDLPLVFSILSITHWAFRWPICFQTDCYGFLSASLHCHQYFLLLSILPVLGWSDLLDVVNCSYSASACLSREGMSMRDRLQIKCVKNEQFEHAIFCIFFWVQYILSCNAFCLSSFNELIKLITT